MNRSEYLLVKMGEECNEVAQRISKILRFGIKEVQPGQTLANDQRLVDEVNDLMAVMILLKQEGIIHFDELCCGDEALINLKMERIRQYYEYSRSQGIITE